MLRNYFSDLELSIDATIDDVKQAYRRLARRHHPDLNPDNPEAEGAFRMIHEAFEFLNSPTRIEKFKRQLAVEVSQIRRMKNTSLQTTKGEKKKIEKTQPSQVTKPKVKSQRQEIGLDLYLKLNVKGELRGSTHIIEFQYSRPCPKCRGNNNPSKDQLRNCRSCNGMGFQFIQRGANRWKKSCEICLGKGYVIAHCDHCHGKSKVFEKQILEFKIPKNIDPKQPICLRGVGNISFDGTKRGDVWVQLEQRK